MNKHTRMLMETIHFMLSYHLPPEHIDALVREFTEFFEDLCSETMLSESDLQEFIEEKWNLEAQL